MSRSANRRSGERRQVSTRVLRRTSALATAALAAAAFLAPAAAVAGDDDFEFADTLSRRGYTDLATEVFNSLIKDTKSTPAKKAEGQYGLALLTYGDARLLAAEKNDKRRKPMKEVLARFDEADAAAAKFIAENAAHPRALEAKLSRGKLLQDKAEYVNLCIESRWLAEGESAGGWQKQVADWFDSAIKLFEDAEKKARDEIDGMKAARKDSGDAWEEAKDRLGLIWLYRLAALYGKGAALPKGDATGTAALTQAIKEGTDDYQWEYGESLRGLWAVHYAGLASVVLDKPEQAFSYLNSAGSFTAEKDNSPAIQDITFQSYREMAKACIAFGRREKTDWIKKGLDDMAQLPQAWPEWKKHLEGQRAGLYWARLYVASGQSDQALTLVQDLVKTAESTGSPTRFELTRELGELLAGGAAVGGKGGAAPDLDPAMLTKIAKSKWGESDFAGAIRAFQVVIASCNEKEDWEKYGWNAWDFISRAYGAQERYFEAYLALDQIEQGWLKDKQNAFLTELTNETGYNRARALDYLARQTKDGDDKGAAKRALDEFTANHPTSPHLLNAAEAAAGRLLSEAEGLRGDAEAYKAKLAEALKAYEALDPNSKTVDKSKALIAQIHQKLGNFDKAIALADEWLAVKRADATEAAVRRSVEEGRRIVLSVALFARAERSAALAKDTDREKVTKANQDLLDSLDKFGASFKDVAANGQSQLDMWRAEGLIGVGKVDEADQLVGKVIQDNPKGRANAYLCAVVGAGLERAAQLRKSVDDMNGYRQLMIRSARRREWVLDNQLDRQGNPAPRNPEVIVAVADGYGAGGDFARSESLLVEAQKSYDGSAETAPNAEEKDRFTKKSRTCRLKLIGLLVEQNKFDAAIPQLEKELAKDPKVRDAFLKKIQATDNIKDPEYKEMLEKTDANKVLLDKLSTAYIKAPSKERLFAAVNLAHILNLTMPKEERHGAEFIEFALRKAEAYLMLAEYTRLPEHFRQALGVVRNNIVIPGYVDGYEQTLPGSKKRGESIMAKADDGLRKLGAK